MRNVLQAIWPRLARWKPYIYIYIAYVLVAPLAKGAGHWSLYWRCRLPMHSFKRFFCVSGPGSLESTETPPFWGNSFGELPLVAHVFRKMGAPAKSSPIQEELEAAEDKLQTPEYVLHSELQQAYGNLRVGSPGQIIVAELLTSQLLKKCTG